MAYLVSERKLFSCEPLFFRESHSQESLKKRPSCVLSNFFPYVRLEAMTVRYFECNTEHTRIGLAGYSVFARSPLSLAQTCSGPPFVIRSVLIAMPRVISGGPERARKPGRERGDRANSELTR